MHGHWDRPDSALDEAIADSRGGVERVNMGIAIVVPVAKILEVLAQPMIIKSEEEMKREILSREPSVSLDAPRDQPEINS
jgi:hypothetical protein